MQIVAFNADELADGSGNKAPITWISKELLKTKHRMDAKTATQAVWDESEMKEYIMNTIKPLIPTEAKNALLTVKKYSRIYQSSEPVNNVLSTDELWIPSCREVNLSGNNGAETSGPTYSGFFSSNSARVKKRVGESAAEVWWLRSGTYAPSSKNFHKVSSSGTWLNSANYNESGIALGFCT